MSLNIKNQEVERLAHALADATGETLTDAVGNALRERLEIVRRRARTTKDVIREVRQIQRSIAGLPIRDARDPDQILYDDFGMPR